MYHLRLKGDHYQMGVKRGNIFQKAHISFPLQLDNFQLEHGKQSEEILRKFFPEICEEVRGVSDAIGTDYLHFISWMLCMGCCMYNLENNIPVEVRGCTAFAYSSNGRTIYGSFSSERIKDEYIETTEHLLKGDYGFMCQYDDEPDFETVWSSIFDLDSLVIYRAEGDPRKKKFVTDNRLHDLIRRG